MSLKNSEWLLMHFRNADHIVENVIGQIGYHPSLFHVAQVCKYWKKQAKKVFFNLSDKERRDLLYCIFAKYIKTNFFPTDRFRICPGFTALSLIEKGYFYPIVRIKRDCDIGLLRPNDKDYPYVHSYWLPYIKASHLDRRWLSIKNFHVLRFACQSGNLKIVKWLCVEFQIHTGEIRHCFTSTKHIGYHFSLTHKNIHTFLWLLETYGRKAFTPEVHKIIKSIPDPYDTFYYKIGKDS